MERCKIFPRPSRTIKELSSLPYTLHRAQSAPELAQVAQLFRDYAATLPISLDYQGFEAELATLPGRYGEPNGVILLATDRAEVPVGCVALRPLATEGWCEMKRLYVAPSMRGMGLAKGLVSAVIGYAEEVGYREMRLDTLDSMTPAITLYRSFGFEFCPPYFESQIPGNVFMGRAIVVGA